MSTLSKWKCASLRALGDASSTFAWNDEGGHERTRVQVQVQASWVQAGDKKKISFEPEVSARTSLLLAEAYRLVPH